MTKLDADSLAGSRNMAADDVRAHCMLSAEIDASTELTIDKERIGAAIEKRDAPFSRSFAISYL